MAADEPKSGKTAQNQRGDDDRRDTERRAGDDRRQRVESIADERRSGRERRQQGPEAERRKVERRINEYRLKPEVLEFINAVNAFKSVHQKPFPTWSEIFEIFVSLGYRKAEE